MLASNADAPAIIQNLENSLKEAADLHWVRNRAIASHVLNSVKNLSITWQKEQKQATRKKLKRLISFANKENGISITSELSAIIKFNSTALLSKIELKN